MYVATKEIKSYIVALLSSTHGRHGGARTRNPVILEVTTRALTPCCAHEVSRGSQASGHVGIIVGVRTDASAGPVRPAPLSQLPRLRTRSSLGLLPGVHLICRCAVLLFRKGSVSRYTTPGYRLSVLRHVPVARGLHTALYAFRGTHSPPSDGPGGLLVYVDPLLSRHAGRRPGSRLRIPRSFRI